MVAGSEGQAAPDIGEVIGAALAAELEPRFEALRRFVDRRVAELSAEVHGATQLLDFNESSLSGQIASIQEQILGLTAAPNASTRNSGLELEAVVQATESAANRIMEAAEAIADWVAANQRDGHDLTALAARVSTIFEACSFQDLTSQRIRRAIEHLQKVEGLVSGLGHPSQLGSVPEPSPHLPVGTGSDLAQDDIDRMLFA